MYEKYAELILKKGVNIQKNQPIVLSCCLEQYEFVRVFTKVAHKLGVVDIYYNFVDEEIKHDQLLSLDEKDILKNQMWDKSIFNEYAKRDCAFVYISSFDPNLMSDIDSKKLSTISHKSMLTQNEARLRRFDNINTWCIALVPTMGLAKKIFPNSNDPINDLWNVIFKCCRLDSGDPMDNWNKYIEDKKILVDKLNSLKLKKLYYKNSLGTDLELELSYHTIWCSVATKKKNSDLEFIPNIPSEEIFTSPVKTGTNGIVYASKVLVYNGNIIKDFYIKFNNGKVVEAKAKEGNDTLNKMIEEYKGMDMLGEIALVPYNSPISNSNILFYETLYDENASCHLALGDAFSECLDVDDNKENYGYNKSDNHVDFMIGTNDLSIIGETFDGEKIEIFKNGNFSI